MRASHKERGRRNTEMRKERELRKKMSDIEQKERIKGIKKQIEQFIITSKCKRVANS